MEELLYTEQLEANFTITEDRIFCEHGKLEFSFENNATIVNSISVYLKRNRIGTNLVNQLEILAIQNGLNIIEVPASPTKEAILFWQFLDYKPSSKDDIFWANKIVRSHKESSWDTPQGIVVMRKEI